MRLTISDEIGAEASRDIVEFLDTLPTGTLQQWPYWTRLNPPSRRQSYLHFKAEREGTGLFSAGLVRLAHIAGGYSFATIKRGPATPKLTDLEDLLPEMEAALYKRGAISLTVNPYCFGDGAEEAVTVLSGLGYATVDRRLQNMPTATAVIPLDGSDDDLMARFNRSCRTKIRVSPKKGITIHPVRSSEEASYLTECMLDMATATHMDIDSQHNFLRHYEFLSQNPDRGCILSAELNGEVFGGAVSYKEGRRGIMYILATRRSLETNVPRSNLILYESMLRLRDLDCTEYDLIGYPDDRYETDENVKIRSKFKASFRPEVSYVTPLMTKPLRPLHFKLANRARSAYRKSKAHDKLKELIHGRGYVLDRK